MFKMGKQTICQNQFARVKHRPRVSAGCRDGEVEEIYYTPVSPQGHPTSSSSPFLFASLLC